MMKLPRLSHNLRINVFNEPIDVKESSFLKYSSQQQHEEAAARQKIQELCKKVETDAWNSYIQEIKQAIYIEQEGITNHELDVEAIASECLLLLGRDPLVALDKKIRQLKIKLPDCSDINIEKIIFSATKILSNEILQRYTEKARTLMLEDLDHLYYYEKNIKFENPLIWKYLFYEDNPYHLHYKDKDNWPSWKNHVGLEDELNSRETMSRLNKELKLRMNEIQSIRESLILSEREFLDQIERMVLSYPDDSRLQEALIDWLGYEEAVLSFVEWICGLSIKERQKLFSKETNLDAETLRFTDNFEAPKSDHINVEKSEKRDLMDENFKDDSKHLPYVFASTTNFVLDEFGQGYRLPLGTIRNMEQTFEEFIVPIKERHCQLGNEKLIKIENAFDETGQKVFEDYENLNLVQSIVFDTAYHTNENLLICAPTGAGKTDIAMLAILREIKHHIVDNMVNTAAFKIVYVAPMKALAAEITQKFSRRLHCLSLHIRELTGDMQLSKKEILETQIIVTTPEKWDVVTRKSVGDTELAGKVRLLIIDEVHLLHDERGSVLESLVARTLRQVETTQSMIRIVGLSATLPNFVDVAKFLRVNPWIGLFYFDNEFRPVPLGQTFIGVKAMPALKQAAEMNSICFQKILDYVKANQQVMVFVHSRKDTVKTAIILKDMMLEQSLQTLFNCNGAPSYRTISERVSKSRNKELRLLFQYGFLIHHAGMLRSDRTLVEQCFSQAGAKVLVCTATLAWGINLPAHAVIIKGTKIYDTQRGGFVDMGTLDVLQIFGRAGRPQYDSHGQGIIITTHDKLRHYLSLLLQQTPIESQFLTHLKDHLNAEIALGTVSTIEEAITWLSYTYWYIRSRRNPMPYGLTYKDLEHDPQLYAYRKELIVIAARQLDQCRMIRFDSESEMFFSTDLGRLASHYYITYETVMLFNSAFLPAMTEADLISLVSSSKEFENLKIRDEEIFELEQLQNDYCMCTVGSPMTEIAGKVNIILQSYISNGKVEDFALISDTAYVAQNAARIIRFLFEVAMKSGWALVTFKLLSLSKSIEKRMWPFENPLYQFSVLPSEIIEKLVSRRVSLEQIYDSSSDEIGSWIRNTRYGSLIKKCSHEIPRLHIRANAQPITHTILKIHIEITPNFVWSDKYHGFSEAWWIWLEDPETDKIHNSEYFIVRKKDVKNLLYLVWMIPISESPPTQFYIKAVSDRWIGSEDIYPLSFQHLILPEHFTPFTPLLNLRPIPITSLQDPLLIQYYQHKFEYFNPIQTQIFHYFYHTDSDALLGAPTGSGKTVAAELAIWRAFKIRPDSKVVYIAPLKALVRERINDWKGRFAKHLKKLVVELTGDVMPSFSDLKDSNLIVTTPEKWDGISRRWYYSSSYLRKISLIIFDEIHLLGQDRGPILEAIVSRTHFLDKRTGSSIRLIGLSTALSNARDLADWLGVLDSGLFNFKPSVRPVPIEIHLQGFTGKHYCPRMASMNKSVFSAIKRYSSDRPVLIFVSSRRQTRLTAQDLIAYCAINDNPKQFLKMSEGECDIFVSLLKDHNVQLTLPFGIGLHHAGLHENDRKILEQLFLDRKIQILIATSTLAWGVNLPAHLVIIKGTEFYDAKRKDYVDMPITDILQMIGRAGRPQFDEAGIACVFVQDIKKNFYKRFIYDPFPVESNLQEVLIEHINAEIVSGMIASRRDAIHYMTWTYYFRRLYANPSYYGLEDLSVNIINQHLSKLIDTIIQDLSQYECIDEHDGILKAKPLGIVASSYYISVKTVHHFNLNMKKNLNVFQLLEILSEASEFSDLPVRHNEDLTNTEFAKQLPLSCKGSMDSPQTKAFLLLQAHLSRTDMPVPDYVTDLKSILDQAIRLIQAMIDIAAQWGYLETTLNSIHLIQMIKQGTWLSQSSLLQLPYFDEPMVTSLNEQYTIYDLCDLIHYPLGQLPSILSLYLTQQRTNKVSHLAYTQ
jgi:activating signal cointegrator complex subunit 3